MNKTLYYLSAAATVGGMLFLGVIATPSVHSAVFVAGSMICSLIYLSTNMIMAKIDAEWKKNATIGEAIFKRDGATVYTYKHNSDRSNKYLLDSIKSDNLIRWMAKEVQVNYEPENDTVLFEYALIVNPDKGTDSTIYFISEDLALWILKISQLGFGEVADVHPDLKIKTHGFMVNAKGILHVGQFIVNLGMASSCYVRRLPDGGARFGINSKTSAPVFFNPYIISTIAGLSE